MPIYEYQCQRCGTFEATQRITDKALVKCPTCKSKVKKLISNTSFQLKGTGWYITDYARKGQANGEAKKDSEAKSSSAPESKSEAKKSESTNSAKAPSTSSPATT